MAQPPRSVASGRYIFLGDVFLLPLVWLASWAVRFLLNDRFAVPINELGFYLRALPYLLPLWLLTLIYLGQYRAGRSPSALNRPMDALAGGVALGVATLALGNLLRDMSLGRSVILLSAAGWAAYLQMSRTVWRRTVESSNRRGATSRRVVIVGAGKTGASVAIALRAHPEEGYEIVAMLDRDSSKVGGEIAGSVVQDVPADLPDFLSANRIDEVYLAVPSMGSDETFDFVTTCEQANVHFKLVASNLLPVITDAVTIGDVGELSVIPLRDARLTPANAMTKRLLDLAIAVPLAIFMLIPSLLILFFIRRDSPGPAVFVHDRIGKDGRRFQLFKFRTMTLDCEPYAPAPTERGDARITPFGGFLRRTSLDELPQLWNVIRGEMSLVGPRPEMPQIVADYEPWQKRRLDVPQGITGLWQVAGRKDLPLSKNLEYDFYYIRNWSVGLDLSLLAKTIRTVLLGRGAF